MKLCWNCSRQSKLLRFIPDLFFALVYYYSSVSLRLQLKLSTKNEWTMMAIFVYTFFSTSGNLKCPWTCKNINKDGLEKILRQKMGKRKFWKCGKNLVNILRTFWMRNLLSSKNLSCMFLKKNYLLILSTPSSCRNQFLIKIFLSFFNSYQWSSFLFVKILWLLTEILFFINLFICKFDTSLKSEINFFLN